LREIEIRYRFRRSAMNAQMAWLLPAWLLVAPLVLAIIDLMRTPRGRRAET